MRPSVRLFSTCVSPEFARTSDYRREVEEVARWSEQAGCEGILIYSSNVLPDPWLVAQTVINATARLCPLVAVQPNDMPPFSAAKMVSSLALLTGRKVHLNLVAGGFKSDLSALCDSASHDERYARLEEYCSIVQALLRSPAPVTFAGQYFQVAGLKLVPPLPENLLPDVFVSGSSIAGCEAARRLGAIAVEYPEPPTDAIGGPAGEGPVEALRAGIRIGIIARTEDAQAWTAAHARFPEDRRGQIKHQIAMKVSDSSWHIELSKRGQGEGTYWLTPFKNYQTFCPYLVGSYARVADSLSRYIQRGYDTFILDIPDSAEDLQHIRLTFNRLCQSALPGE